MLAEIYRVFFVLLFQLDILKKNYGHKLLTSELENLSVLAMTLLELRTLHDARSNETHFPRMFVDLGTV